MWEVVIAVFEAMAERSVAAEIFGWLEKVAPKFARVVSAIKKGQQTLNSMKKYLKYVDPNELISMLKKMPKQMLNQFISNKKTKLELDLENAKEFTKWAQQQNKTVQKDFKEMWNDYLNGDGGEFVILSSSWIKTGQYKSTTEGIGTLTINIQRDGDSKLYGPYTYPVVPLRVWALMKQAKGKNGSGAGSVFWKLYLHGFIKSGIRAYAYKQLFKIAKVQASGEVIDKLAAVQDKIGKLNRDFYKRKNKITNPNSPQDYISWRNDVLKRHNDMKNDLKGRVGQYKTRYQKARKTQQQAKTRLQSFNNKVKTYKQSVRALKDIKKRVF